MITGPVDWLTFIAARQKWALYVIYFPALNLWITSFVPADANVTVP